MFARLLLLFIFVPLIELAVLIDVGRIIGTFATLTLIVVTGIVGAYLARMEGFRVFFTIRHKMSVGQLPANELIDGLIILIAGVLLLTPGIITDCFGFLMLFRPTRAKLRMWLKDKFSSHVTVNGSPPQTHNGTPV